MIIIRTILLSLVLIVPIVAAGPPPTYSKPSISIPKPSVSVPKPSVSTPKPIVSVPKPTISTPKPSVSTPTYSKPSVSTESTKPTNTSTTFGNKLSQLQAKNESKTAFQKGTESKSTYITPTGKSINIDPKDQHIVDLRNRLSQEKWTNHELRRDRFYSPYINRPLIVYNDPYSSYFHYWLLDQSVDTMAMFLFHHRYAMEDRYNSILLYNVQLQHRIAILESQNIKRDLSYTPSGITDPDLIYDTNYIHTVYNPVPSHLGRYFLFTFVSILCIILVIGLIYLIFIKEWS